MIWNKDYETVNAARNTTDEQTQTKLQAALNYARNHVTDGWKKEDDEFIVINVEGYSCIALVTSEWSPIEICDRVFPFDRDRIYPMQEIEQKIYFKVYH